jgi:hypothetical protein
MKLIGFLLGYVGLDKVSFPKTIGYLVLPIYDGQGKSLNFKNFVNRKGDFVGDTGKYLMSCRGSYHRV